MATSETAARNALDTLRPLVQPAAQARFGAAVAALDRFMALNAQIIALVPRNTNVAVRSPCHLIRNGRSSQVRGDPARASPRAGQAGIQRQA